jgi:hypothetical protein
MNSTPAASRARRIEARAQRQTFDILLAERKLDTLMKSRADEGCGVAMNADG